MGIRPTASVGESRSCKKPGMKLRNMIPFVLFLAVLLCASCRGQGAQGSTATSTASTADRTNGDGQGEPTASSERQSEKPSSPETPGQPGTPDKTGATDVDLILFMGQSNMAGRGSYAESATVGEGHAYEFRAVSDPTKLYPLQANFGLNENTKGGADDGSKKTGSLVPAFCESYFQATGTPVVAVSCSQGGTRIDQWQTGGGKLEDAVARLNAAKRFLDASEDYRIRRIYMVWCQGESDARNRTTAERYLELTKAMYGVMQSAGVEQCFLIGIGNYNGTEDPKDSFDYIQEAQKKLCAESADFLLVSTSFADLRDRMKDDFHFFQDAYNLVGTEAGSAAGAWVCAQNGGSGLQFSDYDNAHRDSVTWKQNG